MSIKVIATGLRRLITDMDGYIEELNDGLTAVLTNEASAVEIEAKTNHRFVSHSHNLENSAKGEYSREGNSHIVEFKLDPTFTTVKDGSDRSYGVFIHEGTYQGYKQSKIAPKFSNSISKSGKGWKADPFLWNAIEAKWKPEEKILKMNNKLKRKYQRV